MTGGLFAVLDDIATLLDDAAVMSKVAAKKTVGILGDDLAVNAEKATGFQASRELPVLWAITKGSLLNKIMILPLAFILSSLLPWLIVPLLLVGGAYLCYEGVEKIFHGIFSQFPSFFPQMKEPQIQEQQEDGGGIFKKNIDADTEKKKISSAIRTDFILSIEIVMIALGSVMDQSFFIQVVAVSSVAVMATLGVYGFVALIVRMDDMGFFLISCALKIPHSWQIIASFLKITGLVLAMGLPYVIRILTIVGTVAMLLVGGGMYVHNLHALHALSGGLPALLVHFVVGLIVGVCVFVARFLLQKVKRFLAK